MPGRILYQFTLSPYCVKVRRILEYKRLEYGTVEVHPLARGEVVRVSGQKRVPVLVDVAEVVKGRDRPPDVAVSATLSREAHSENGAAVTGTVVADSTAIAEYLDSRYPEPPVYPSDPVARARVRALEDWSDEKLAGDLVPFKVFTPGNARKMVEQSKVFYPPFWYDRALVSVGPAILRRLVAWRRQGRTLERLRSDYERDLDLLEALASGGSYLAGERPTVLDFAVWGLLRTMEGLSGEELLERRPRLHSWYQAMKALPGPVAAG